MKPVKTKLPASVSVVEAPSGRIYLLFGAPTDSNLPHFLEYFHKYNVKHLFRLCEPTYDVNPVTQAGITVHACPFEDGSAPPKEVQHKLMKAIHEIYRSTPATEALGMHCIAGLGRAPLVAAIALIEEEKMDPFDALQLIRSKRPDAFNRKQIEWISAYKKSKDSCTLL